mgnify:CR=1 FL=1
MNAIDYDYDYEREPYEVEQHWREFDVNEGEFNVLVEVRTYCIRRGTFSPIASDPEEYYGIFETAFEVIECDKYDEKEGDWVEYDIDKLPAVVYNRLCYEFEE